MPVYTGVHGFLRASDRSSGTNTQVQSKWQTCGIVQHAARKGALSAVSFSDKFSLRLASAAGEWNHLQTALSSFLVINSVRAQSVPTAARDHGLDTISAGPMDISNASRHPSTGPTAAGTSLAMKTNSLALAAYLPWLVVLGWLSSVAWFLCDDAFISFRYVRNLLSGHGLVFNPGEYVEGYTNFLWILELAAIWGIFGVRPEHGAPWLSVAYTVGTVAVTLLWVARLPSLESRALIGWMALGLLCSSATFAVWTSAGGLETRQFTFFVVLAVVCLTLHRNGRGGLVSASLSLAAAELTRPEGLMLAAVCFSWFAAQLALKEGRVSARMVRQILWLAVPFTVIVLAHYLGRFAY